MDDEDHIPEELQLKLDEAARGSGLDYPNWRRGIIYGICSIFSAVLIVPLVFMIMPDGTGNAGYLRNNFLIAGALTFSVVITVFAVGAFRPPRSHD